MKLVLGVGIEEGFAFADGAHLAAPGIGNPPAGGQGIELRPAVTVDLIFLLLRQSYFALGGLDFVTVIQGHDGKLFQGQHRIFGAAGRQWRQPKDQSQQCSPYTAPKNHIPLLCYRNYFWFRIKTFSY